MAEVVRELAGIGEACALVRHGGAWFRVSTIDAVRYGGGGGTQTLAWPCDETGRVTAWVPVAGGWTDRAGVIAELASRMC